MHASANWFVKRILTRERVEGKTVIEIGSYNVNGSARDHVAALLPQRYVGVDMAPQDRYVDVVADASNLQPLFPKESFDIVISTEMLEHAEKWREAIEGMLYLLAPGGLLLITARGPGFPLHSYPSDFWRFTVEDLAAAIHGVETIWLSDDTDPASPGVFYAGIKRPHALRADPKPMQPKAPQVDAGGKDGGYSHPERVTPDWGALKPTHVIAVKAGGDTNHIHNLGDDVQTEAALRMFGELPLLDRERPASWPEDSTVVLCHWIGYSAWVTANPEPTKARVILCGCHFTRDVVDTLHAKREWLKRCVREQGFPAMCRDIYTRDALRAIGVDAEFGGCISQTLPAYDGTRSGKVAVDTHPTPGYAPITNHTHLGGVTFQQRRGAVTQYLDTLRTAEHVVTTRLHALLPCKAFGTPVDLARGGWPDERVRRFSGHAEMFAP